jgi:predicted permease
MCGAPIRDRSHIAPTITYATVSIALVAVVLRCIARADRFALDDIFAVVAFTTGLPQAIITVLMSKKGFGKDIWTLSAENITWILKVSLSPARI